MVEFIKAGNLHCKQFLFAVHWPLGISSQDVSKTPYSSQFAPNRSVSKSKSLCRNDVVGFNTIQAKQGRKTTFKIRIGTYKGSTCFTSGSTSGLPLAIRVMLTLKTMFHLATLSCAPWQHKAFFNLVLFLMVACNWNFLMADSHEEARIKPRTSQ